MPFAANLTPTPTKLSRAAADMADQVRARLVIRGVVQGVGYRYFVRKTAVHLGIGGLVRNRFDGSVEVVVEGDRAAIAALIAALKEGPRFASVERVDVEWQEATGEFKDFEYAF
jgi:acylphosphatase